MLLPRQYLLMLTLFFSLLHGISLSSSKSEIESLKEHKTIEVLIESGISKDTKNRITEQELQTDVELALRMVGITVVDENDSAWTTATPWLYVNAQAIEYEVSEYVTKYVYDIDVSFRQDAWLYDGRFCFATTWHDSYLGYAGEHRIGEVIQDGVKSLTDRFLNDYLKANPKTGN